jgi:hypothetical protein
MIEGNFGAARSLARKNYFTVPYDGQSSESADFEEKPEALIESRY